MFCRHCGTTLAPDSQYCAKCGKPLFSKGSLRWEAVVAKLKLKTPYPYFGVLVLAFVIWGIQPRQRHADYSLIGWELELEGESSYPEDNIFRHHMSLILENLSDEPIGEIPVELTARLEPEQAAEIVYDFLGRQLVIMRDGVKIPLIVVLTDALDVGEKRRYTIDGIVTTQAPAEITYEVRGEDTSDVLATLRAEIRRPPVEPGGPVARLHPGGSP